MADPNGVPRWLPRSSGMLCTVRTHLAGLVDLPALRIEQQRRRLEGQLARLSAALEEARQGRNLHADILELPRRRRKGSQMGSDLLLDLCLDLLGDRGHFARLLQSVGCHGASASSGGKSRRGRWGRPGGRRHSRWGRWRSLVPTVLLRVPSAHIFIRLIAAE